MKLLLTIFPVTIILTGLLVMSQEIIEEEVINMDIESTTDVPSQSSGSNAIPTPPGKSDKMDKHNVLNSLGKVVKKLIQFEVNITSDFNRRVAAPIVQALRMHGEPESTIARGLALFQRVASMDDNDDM